MKICNTITKLITITTAVAAMAALSFALMPARAAGQVALGNGSVRFMSNSIGFVPGNTLRFSVVYPNAAQQGSARIVAQVKLFDAQGNVLARSEEVLLPLGQLRIFDFNRDALSAAGE